MVNRHAHTNTIRFRNNTTFGSRQLVRVFLTAAVLCVGSNTTAWAEPSQPDIISRKSWGAKPAKPGMKVHEPRSLVVHHSAVRRKPGQDLKRKMRGLQAFSQRVEKLADGRRKPAWGDVPYHFTIGADGDIAEGRDMSFAGDTNTGYDTRGHIQIVVEGNFEVEKPSAPQLKALTGLLAWLSAKWRIPPDKITGHNDHAATKCPGKHLHNKLSTLRKTIAAEQ